MSALLSWLLSGIRLPLVLASVALVIYAAFFANPYDMRILTLCGIYVLLVLGFQFVFGHAGAVSLAQATFFGIGGYITGIVATHFGAGFLVTFPLSIVTSTRRPKSAFMRKAIALIGDVVREELRQNSAKTARRRTR